MAPIGSGIGRVHGHAAVSSLFDFDRLPHHASSSLPKLELMN